MDHLGISSQATADSSVSSAKRKRSDSIEALHVAHPPKVAKTHSSHLQINYLARMYSDTLPLIATDDPMPALLDLLSHYDGILQRHESMAGNLGARPLGPLLIRKFERLFDGPPRVLKSHGKEGNIVGWLDVVEFARNKPEQFNLEKTREGVRCCQIYTKQSRVEITEEDYILIKSGMPEKMIPSQPIVEDEEKELGTLEILEKSLGQIVQLADQVSARARQLNHKMKNRKNAIISRREAEATVIAEEAGHSPSLPTSTPLNQTNGEPRPSVSPTSGFTAVNSATQSSQDPRPSNNITSNGTSFHGASAATRAELMSKFMTSSERASLDQDATQRSVRGATASKSKPKPTSDSLDYTSNLQSASPVPIPNTPSSLIAHVKPVSVDRYDDSGPYKAEMVARMEQLQRGDRIQPPCDRCRRLHMDCLKNLTACMGCTKKHAKCSWKDVVDDELRDDYYPIEDEPGHGAGGSEGSSGGYVRDDRQGVRDEELLGEDDSADEEEEMREHEVASRNEDQRGNAPAPYAPSMISSFQSNPSQPERIHVASHIITSASPTTSTPPETHQDSQQPSPAQPPDEPQIPPIRPESAPQQKLENSPPSNISLPSPPPQPWTISLNSPLKPIPSPSFQNPNVGSPYDNIPIYGAGKENVKIVNHEDDGLAQLNAAARIVNGEPRASEERKEDSLWKGTGGAGFG